MPTIIKPQTTRWETMRKHAQSPHGRHCYSETIVAFQDPKTNLCILYAQMMCELEMKLDFLFVHVPKFGRSKASLYWLNSAKYLTVDNIIDYWKLTNVLCRHSTFPYSNLRNAKKTSNKWNKLKSAKVATDGCKSISKTNIYINTEWPNSNLIENFMKDLSLNKLLLSYVSKKVI
jgi:hypothetical protein